MHRVLIVEDQTDIRKLIRMTLEFEDFEIHEAGDGAFGLSMARAIKPDIVLLDVMMPGEMDGLHPGSAVRVGHQMRLSCREQPAFTATSADQRPVRRGRRGAGQLDKSR